MRRALLALLLQAGACVDKAPPPMWPAPPPPRVATPIHADEPAPLTAAPVPVVGAPTLAVPGPLDGVPTETSILDPAGPAAAAVPKPVRSSSRPVPAHK